MASKYPLLKDLIGQLSLEKLEDYCERNLLIRLTEFVSAETCRDIARYMGLSEKEVECIMSCNSPLTDRKVDLLTSDPVLGAKYSKLLHELYYGLGRTDLVEKIVEEITLKDKRYEDNEYTKYLKDLYYTFTPDQRYVWQPPIKVSKYISLSLQQMNDRKYNSAAAHLGEFTSNDLVALLSQSDKNLGPKSMNRKIILLEGLSGIGKSVLALHICQQWRDGVLFTEYKYVIFVELQKIQKATSLCDILPCSHNKEMAQAVAQTIQAVRGKSCLFICDGWDELPQSFHNPNGNSVVCNLLFHPERLSVQHSAVVITSRPDTTASLNEIITSHAQITGFASAEIKDYFIEVLRNQSLANKINRLYPSLYGTCSVPLNALLLSHIFNLLSRTSPCYTQHEVCCKLVLLHIIREEYQSDTVQILSLSNLSDEVKEKLKEVAELAYKSVYTDKDLQWNHCKPFPTLGLLQSFECFSLYGTTKTYRFMHRPIQQLLAAYHIFHWSPLYQADFFRDIFTLSDNKSAQENLDHQAIAQYVSGFTNLQDHRLMECFIDAVQKYNANRNVLLFLIIVRCLQEAKNERLSQAVASELDSKINLKHIQIELYDCLSLGYLLYHFNNDAEVILSDSTIDDLHIEYFCETFSRSKAKGQYRPKLKLDLANNSIHDDGVKALVPLLRNGQLVHLDLRCNSISDDGAVAIAGALKFNSSLTQLHLSHNPQISDQGKAAIADALKSNSNLMQLKPFT
jgi:hypothetical protein